MLSALYTTPQFRTFQMSLNRKKKKRFENIRCVCVWWCNSECLLGLFFEGERNKATVKILLSVNRENSRQVFRKQSFIWGPQLSYRITGISRSVLTFSNLIPQVECGLIKTLGRFRMTKFPYNETIKTFNYTFQCQASIFKEAL